MTDIKMARPNSPADWEGDEDTDSPYRMYPQLEDENVPNVVRIDVPANEQDDEAAAWVYVPSKDTVYVGPYGSSHLDMADSLKHVLDLEKGEKLLTGALYQDGFSDIYSVPEDEPRANRVLEAISTYFDLYYGDVESFPDIEDADWGDDASYNWSNKNKAKPVTDAIPEDYRTDDAKWETYWKSKELHGDRGASDPTISPLGENTSGWSGEDWVAWTRQPQTGYSWTPRENLPHFRWSYGNQELVPQATHNGFFPWPVEGAWPDHHSQTGSNGLGYSAQGRVYPHTGNRWEILTWPQRPRYIHDQQMKKILQNEAQQAAKDWLMDELDIPEENIYFTEGDYGRMVIDYTSPTYGGGKKVVYNDDDASAMYGDATDPDTEFVDSDGNVYTYGPDQTRKYTETFMDDLTKSYNDLMTSNLDWKPKKDPVSGVDTGPGRNPNTNQPALSPPPEGFTKEQWDALTPEQRWEYKVRRFEGQQQTPLWQERPSNQSVGTPFSEGMAITDNAGKTTVISEEDYEQAVRDYGEDKWFFKWLKPEAQLEPDIDIAAEYERFV